MGVNNNGLDICYNVQTAVDDKYCPYRGLCGLEAVKTEASLGCILTVTGKTVCYRDAKGDWYSLLIWHSLTVLFVLGGQYFYYGETGNPIVRYGHLLNRKVVTIQRTGGSLSKSV